jgi:hypothetical protein
MKKDPIPFPFLQVNAPSYRHLECDSKRIKLDTKQTRQAENPENDPARVDQEFKIYPRQYSTSAFDNEQGNDTDTGIPSFQDLLDPVSAIAVYQCAC